MSEPKYYIRSSSGAVIVPLKWYCKQCGTPINAGFTWNGLCVVCSEPFLNPHYEEPSHGQG
jgi:hypothetical protein